MLLSSHIHSVVIFAFFWYSLFLALNDMTQEKLRIEDALRLEQRLSARIAEKTDQQLQRLAILKL